MPARTGPKTPVEPDSEGTFRRRGVKSVRGLSGWWDAACSGRSASERHQPSTSRDHLSDEQIGPQAPGFGERHLDIEAEPIQQAKRLRCLNARRLGGRHLGARYTNAFPGFLRNRSLASI